MSEDAEPVNDGRPEISVVIPVYNSQETAPELCRRLVETMTQMNVAYEVIFVDDGSRDRSAEVFAGEVRANPAFRLVKLVRNFGQHQALTAGLALSHGRWVVLMDDDLQNPPEEIPKLYARAREGFDDVCGVRENRRDSAARRTTSKVANWLMKTLFGQGAPDSISAFRIMSRRLVDEYLRLKEDHTYVAALIAWLGFPTASVVVRHEPRARGRSGYSYRKLMRIWLNIAIGFSDRPLRLATWTGCLFSVAAFCVAIRAVVLYVTADEAVLGYTSLIASQLLSAGVMMVFLGVIGEYLARIYREVKGRPRYIYDREASVPPLPSDRCRGGCRE